MPATILLTLEQNTGRIKPPTQLGRQGFSQWLARSPRAGGGPHGGHHNCSLALTRSRAPARISWKTGGVSDIRSCEDYAWRGSFSFLPDSLRPVGPSG